MMQAFVSGKAARVAFVQGTDVSYFNADKPTEIIRSNLSELNTIFLNADDVEKFNVSKREQAYPFLLRSFNFDRGLHLLDIALTDEDEDFRSEAATLFEELINDAPSLELIKNYVLSIYNSDLLESDELDKIRIFAPKFVDFIEDIRKAQVHILRVNTALDKALQSIDVNHDTAAEFRKAAIDKGVFRGLVEAGNKPQEANKAIMACYKALLHVSNSRLIIQNWTKDIIYRTTKTEMVRLERELEKYEDTSFIPRNFTEKSNYENFIAVKRQILAIIEKIKIRDNPTARRYTDQLINMQMQNGGAVYAAKSLSSLAVEARKLGQFSLEVQWAEASVELVPTDGRGVGLLADTYLRLSRIPEAEMAFCRSIELGMDEFGSVGLARVQRACGKFDRALETIQAVKKRMGRENISPETWSAYAETLRDMWREDEALQAYDNAIIVHADSPLLHCGKAAVLADLGRLHEASKLYELVNNQFGDHAAAWCGLAETYKVQGAWEDALRIYEIAINKFPESVISYCGHADVLRSMGRLNDALEAYVVASKKFPFSSSPVSGEAETLKDMQQFSVSLERFKVAQTKFPFDQHLRNGFANALKLDGQFEEALRQFELNVRDFPYNLHCLSGRANLLKLLGNYNAALAAYDDIIKKRPDYQFANNAKAAIFVAQGFYSLAEEILPKTPPLTEVDWGTIHIKGMSLLRQGHLDRAFEVFSSGMQSPFFRQRAAFETALAVTKMKQGDLNAAYDYVKTSTDNLSQLISAHILLQQGDEPAAYLRLISVNDNLPEPVLRVKSHLQLIINNDNVKITKTQDAELYEQEIELILQAA